MKYEEYVILGRGANTEELRERPGGPRVTPDEPLDDSTVVREYRDPPAANRGTRSRLHPRHRKWIQRVVELIAAGRLPFDPASGFGRHENRQEAIPRPKATAGRRASEGGENVGCRRGEKSLRGQRVRYRQTLPEER